MKPVTVGIVGAGVVSGEYLATLRGSHEVHLAGITDSNLTSALEKSQEHSVPLYSGLDEMLADLSIEVIVNLTTPTSHAEVTRMALMSGKHVWSEKPLASTYAQGVDLVSLARDRGLLLHCAPDTLLGTAFQRAIAELNSGSIGRPASALAIVQSPGPDNWHSNPEFLFAHGAGPLFEVGPYYLTALVLALGNVAAIDAAGGTGISYREIRAGARAGTQFQSQAPTTVSLILWFESGAFATLLLSWDSPIRRKGLLEVTGSRGSLRFGDPNTFEGRVERISSDGSAEVIGALDPETDTAFQGRGLGVLRLSRSIRNGVLHNSDELALHVLDIMESASSAIKLNMRVAVTGHNQKVL